MCSKKRLSFHDRGSGNAQKMAKATAEGMRSRLLNVAGEDVGKFLTPPDFN